MPQPDPFENKDIQRLKLFLYLMPVVGFFPALWTLYYRSGDRQQQDLSRVIVTLTLAWLMSYLLLGIGAETIDAFSLQLWLTSSILTSSYFGVHIWLMVRLWQRKSVRLPGISQLGDRIP
jgi:glucose-6-phosphate-specific signal transduction histidine kinase